MLSGERDSKRKKKKKPAERFHKIFKTDIQTAPKSSECGIWIKSDFCILHLLMDWANVHDMYSYHLISLEFKDNTVLKVWRNQHKLVILFEASPK